MKTFLMAAALFTTALTLPVSAQTPNVTYLDHEKVAAALAKGASLMTAPVLYIIEGEATFVSGGTMVGGKVTRPDQHLGTDIQGGTTQHLTKGDVIVVQAGTPHWFKEVPKSVNYFVVKVLK